MISRYLAWHPFDLIVDEHGVVATTEDLAIFLRVLNSGSIFGLGEQEIYASIYEFKLD